MATINTFGITPADITGAVHNLSITPASSPTESQVEDYITYAAAEVASEAAASGIDVSGLEATSSAYLLFKRAVINKVAADILVARNRGDAEAGQYYLDNYLRIMKTVRNFPQRVEVDSDNGPDLAEYVEQSADDIPDIEWYGTMEGKIVQGGL